MAITVKFGGVEIGNVTSVTPGDSFNEDAIIDVASLVGTRSRTIAVSGFVKKAGLDKTALVAEQKAFTETLAGKGPSTIEYPGCTPYTTRLASIEWEDWTGGPIVHFTLAFKADVENPFASAVKISPVEGSEPPKTLRPTPAVTDSFRNPDVLDEKPDPARDKTITLSGVLRGKLVEVAAEEAALKAFLTSSRFFTVEVSSGTYTCTVGQFSFSTPAGTEAEAVKTYQIELATLPDFSLEGRSLKGGPLTIAGIAFDVATSFSHSVGRGPGGEITSESINVSGKKFFSAMSLAEAFKGEVEAKVKGLATFASATGKILAVKSIGWSEAKWEGHYPDGSRRYALSFNLSLEIDTASTPRLSGVVLRIPFAILTSHSMSVSLDDEGLPITHSESASGKVDSVPSIRPGESVTEDGRRYFITSLNLGNIDPDGRRKVSVSGQTLDTAKAVADLFPSFFFGFFLDHVDSTSKSVNYSFDRCEKRFVAQSINASVSGFTIGGNKGVLDLIGTVKRSVGSFIITSVSTGAPETKRRGGRVEKRFPISISGVLHLVGEHAGQTDHRHEECGEDGQDRDGRDKNGSPTGSATHRSSLQTWAS